MLLMAIPDFRFPRFKLYDYTESTYDEATGDLLVAGQYNLVLTQEEIKILAKLAQIEWFNEGSALNLIKIQNAK